MKFWDNNKYRKLYVHTLSNNSSKIEEKVESQKRRYQYQNKYWLVVSTLQT